MWKINKYEPFFFNAHVEICKLLKNKGSGNSMFNVIFSLMRRYGNIPNSCPIKKVLDFYFLYNLGNKWFIFFYYRVSTILKMPYWILNFFHQYCQLLSFASHLRCIMLIMDQFYIRSNFIFRL
jgi:hypothetical protein